jgi:1,5-anhydro-D-fructose reductase (1,5-anhydro-D-mannitol-forming)
MTTMRCALVGTGNWAATALLPALRARPGADVIACVGGSLDESRQFAEKHAIPNAYSTLDEMLARETLDVAVVATPDHLHAGAVKALLAAGVATYCEKPLSNDAPTAHELVALQGAKNVPATVGYSFRFNPAVQALKADLEAGKFGEIWLIELAEQNPQFHPDGGREMNWKGDPSQAAGGALFEYGSHVIDMGAWLLGPIARVSSSFKRVLKDARLDDIATLQMEFASGAQGILISSWVLSGGFPGTCIKLHGSKAVGEVLLDDRMPEGQRYSFAPAIGAVGSDRKVEPMADRRSDAATRHIAAFLASVRDKGPAHPTLPTLAQAAHVQDVLAAALIANKQWQQVGMQT